MEGRLELIDLDQDLPGQRRFISCWLWQSPAETFIVDPGPPATAAHLIRSLEELGVERLDHILLTHIHLDHGGATAQVLERWPAARVICHKNGRSHLVDPSRLWQGSLEVLGHKAEVYGRPHPVPEAAIDTEAEGGIQIIPTPGHAPHHLAFLYQGNLFVGEAAGTFARLDDDEYYLRPATPPRFFLPVATGSLDRLLDLDPQPLRICFAHHGQFTGDSREVLQAARDQLELWTATANEFMASRTEIAAFDQEALLPELADVLRAVDPRFARGVRLPADIQERERDFTRQTLRGILGYLKSTTP